MHIAIRLGIAACLWAMTAGAFAAPAAPGGFGGETPVRLNGVEYRLKSVILTEDNSYLSMRIAMTLTNLGQTPVGVFVEQQGTSVMTDTGMVFNADFRNNAGIYSCSLNRQSCAGDADRYVTEISPGTPDHMSFTITSTSGRTGVSHQVLAGASTADVSFIFYVRNAKGIGGFVPVTFEDVRIRNMEQ
jgi:hypothetical protein